MEIRDYLYAVRRRLWLPVAIPLAAAIVTAGVLYIQPEKYQATATVVVPALSAQGYSTSAVTQYVSTFKDVLVSAPVIDQVAVETHAKRSDLAAGLSAATATASSNIIQVTYTGPNKKDVALVARNAAVDSLDILLAPQLSAASSASTTSLAALTQANQNISDYTAKTGFEFPIDQYKYKSQELSQFLVLLTEAKLSRDQKRVDGLTQIVKDRQAELTTLAAIVVQYQTLDDEKHAAQAVYDKSQIDLNKVNGEIASDHDPRTVTVRNLGHISRTPLMLKFGGVALGVALLLSLAFIVFMEFFRPAVAQIPYLRSLAIPPRPLQPVMEAGGSAGTVAAVAAPGAAEAAPERAVASVASGSAEHANGDAPVGAEKERPKRTRS